MGGGNEAASSSVERAANNCGGYVGDLVAVNEAQAMPRLDRNAVEEVQLWDLKNVVYPPELGPRRTDYWRAYGQG